MGLGMTAVAAAALLLSTAVTAHEHHSDKIPDGHAVSADPIDSILWIHILIQTLAWGIIFPTGMVLGVSTWSYHPGEASLTGSDNTLQMARPSTNSRLPPRYRRVLPRS
jgi:hypothetical protein